MSLPDGVIPDAPLPEGVIPDALPPGVIPDAPVAAAEPPDTMKLVPVQFDEQAAQDEAAKDAELQGIFDASLLKAPDKYAGTLELARQTNAPIDVVEQRYDEFKRSAESLNFDPGEFRRKYPVLYDTIVKNPHVAPVLLKEQKVREFSDAVMKEPEKQSLWAGALSAAAAGMMNPSGMSGLDMLKVAEPPPAKPPTFTAYQQSTLTSPADIALEVFLRRRKQSEIASLGTRQMAYDAKQLAAESSGDPGAIDVARKAAYENRKSIVRLQQELGLPVDYGQGALGQFGIDVVEGLGSQIDSLKAEGLGGAAGAVLAGGAAALATKGNPTATVLAAKKGGKLAAEVAGFASSFNQEAGSAYLEFRDTKDDNGHPMDPAVAIGAAAVYGIAAAAVEVASIGPMLDAFGFKGAGEAIANGEGKGAFKQLLQDRTKRELLKEFGKAWAKSAASEGAEEGVQQAMQFVANWAGRSITAGSPQSFDVKQLASEVASSTYQGAVGAAFGLGGLQLASHVTQDIIRTELSRRSAARVAAITNLADSSAARAAPKEVAQLIQNETERSGQKVDTLYVDPVRLTQAVLEQGGDPEHAARELMGDQGPERMRRALLDVQDTPGNRATLEVPVQEFLEKWGGKPIVDLIKSDIAARPGHLTTRELAESKQWQERLRTQAEAIAKGEVPSETTQAQAEPSPVRPEAVAMGIDEPLFRSPEEAGMTGEQFAAYLKDREQATRSAALRVQRKAVETQAALASDDWSNAVKGMVPFAKQEFENNPAWRAWRYLKQGESVTSDGRTVITPEVGKLDRAAVSKIMGKDIEGRLRGRIVKNGESPEHVAQRFGFKDGRAMFNAIWSLPEDKNDAIRRRSEEMANDAHPELMTNLERLSEEATRALHNEGTSDWLLKEWAALKKKAGSEGLPPVEAIKLAAREIVENRPVRRLDVGLTLNRERSAAEHAAIAAAKGNYKQAYVYKQQQLLAHFQYRELDAALQDRDQFERLVAMMVDKRRRSELGKAGKEFLDAADQILEAIGAKAPETNAAVLAERQPLSSIMPALEQAGISAAFPAESLSAILSDPPTSDWRDLSLADMRTADTALVQLYTAARDANRVTLEGRRVAIEELVQDIATEAERLPDKGKAANSTKVRPAGAWWARQVVRTQDPNALGAALKASRRSPEAMFQDLGPKAYQFFWQDGYLRGEKAEDALTLKVSKFFAEKWDALPKALQRVRFDELTDLEGVPLSDEYGRAGPRPRMWMWMTALNMGNASNRERLVNGYGWNEQAVWDWLNRNMQKPEWDFVQSVWDLMDKELYPEVERAYTRVNGVPPRKIEAEAFATPHGVYRGGYFPAKYDPIASRLGANQSMADVEKLYGQKAGQFSVVKSFTKERADKYTDVVNLDWGLVPGHVASVIHYVSFDGFVRDAARVLNNPKMQATIQRRLGLPYFAQLASPDGGWLATVASANSDAVPQQLRAFNRILGMVKSRYVQSSLAYSLPVAAGDFTQPLFALSSGKVGLKYGVPALIQTMATFPSSRKFALENSHELRHRSEHLVSTLRRQLGEVGRGSGLLDRARQTAWIFMEATDKLASTLIWHMAYREGMAKGDATHASAVAHAESVVSRTMPSHDPARQPALLRDKRGFGALTAFTGFWSTVYNAEQDVWSGVLADLNEADTLGEKALAFSPVAKAAAYTLATWAIVGPLSEYLSGRGREDDESVPEWIVRKALATPFLYLPIVGAVGEEGTNRLVSLMFEGEAKHRQFSIRGSPLAAAGEHLWKVVDHIASSEREPDQKIWDVLEGSGILFDLPIGSSQVMRTGRYITGGEDRSPAGVASGIAYGEHQGQPHNPIRDVFGD